MEELAELIGAEELVELIGMKELAELVWGSREVWQNYQQNQQRWKGREKKETELETKEVGTVETEIEGVVEVTREGSQGMYRQAGKKQIQGLE